MDLVVKEKEFAMFLNDKDYDKAKMWMANCADQFTWCGIEVIQYVEIRENTGNPRLHKKK